MEKIDEKAAPTAAEARWRFLSFLEERADPVFALEFSNLLEIWLRSPDVERELKERVRKLLDAVGKC